MSDDHEILRDVMDEHGLTAKWLTQVIGRSASHVYRYLAGEATIPSVVWRHIYARTRDERVLNLFVGESPVSVFELPDEIFARLDAPTLKQICVLRKEQLAVESSLLDIIGDGRIDKTDAAAIERYQRNHTRSVATACRLYKAIMDEYERSRKL